MGRITTVLMASLLIAARVDAADADVTPVDPARVTFIQREAPVVVAGTFHLIAEQEPEDGIGNIGDEVKVEFRVGEAFKGAVTAGDTLTLRVANGSLAYRDTFITREQMFFFRQDVGDKYHRDLLAKYEQYGREAIQRGLTAAEIAEMVGSFGQEYEWLAARTSDLHIQRGRVLDTGEIPEQPLIGEGREYILALQPDDAATYSLWSAGVGLWSGVDTLFVRKVLAQPAAR